MSFQQESEGCGYCRTKRQSLGRGEDRVSAQFALMECKSGREPAAVVPRQVRFDKGGCTMLSCLEPAQADEVKVFGFFGGDLPVLGKYASRPLSWKANRRGQPAAQDSSRMFDEY